MSNKKITMINLHNKYCQISNLRSKHVSCDFSLNLCFQIIIISEKILSKNLILILIAHPSFCE